MNNTYNNEIKHPVNSFFFCRPKWFIITRFIAVIGVVLTLIFSKYVFSITTVNYNALWFLSAILLLINITYLFYYKYGDISETGNNFNNLKMSIFIIVQINIDLIILTLMLHFSGGASNPFVFYYFFHTILSSILLSKKTAYFESIFAAFLFNGMTILEGLKIIKHYNLFHSVFFTEATFIAGICFALTSALIIAVYMTTSIMEGLRTRQKLLENALEETERIEMEKSKFLDVVAHDLKGPLASIETMITSAISVYGDEIPPKIRQVMEKIPKRTSSLLRFIQELLDFSKISSLSQLELQLKTLNFLPIVTATVEMYMIEALEKDIKITLNADSNIPPINGNVNHLERMVSNLVSNAIRYTPEKGSVNIKVTYAEHDVILTVADTGIGIPEDELPKIFNDFYRAKNARKFFISGTGLGLSISKAIVEKHGGKITVNSTEGEGTIFTVYLPAIQ